MPMPVSVRLPVPRLRLPKVRALLLVKETVLLPLLLSETAPVKRLFCVSVMVLAPALKLEVPLTVSGPVSVIAPAVVTLKFPEIVEVPKIRLLLFCSATLLPLPMDTVCKTFETLVKVMLLADPAVKLAVLLAPFKRSAPPLCVIAPFAVTAKLPLMLIGPKAIALTSSRLRLFAAVTATELKSLLALVKVMELLLFAVKVVAPPTISAPLLVIWLPVVMPSVPLMLEAPRSRPLAEASCTSRALLIATVPKLLLAFVRLRSVLLPTLTVSVWPLPWMEELEIVPPLVLRLVAAVSCVGLLKLMLPPFVVKAAPKIICPTPVGVRVRAWLAPVLCMLPFTMIFELLMLPSKEMVPTAVSELPACN